MSTTYADSNSLQQIASETRSESDPLPAGDQNSRMRCNRSPEQPSEDNDSPAEDPAADAQLAPRAIAEDLVAVHYVQGGVANLQHDEMMNTMSSCLLDNSEVFDRSSAWPAVSFPVHPWIDRRHRTPLVSLSDLPNEVLLYILGFLEVCDLLATSRTSRQLRTLSLAPILHALRLRRTRAILPPLLYSPSRPSLADLIARHIFLTHTTVVSRKLARSLVAIRLARRLAVRPSPEVLVERCVLPPECIPGQDGPGKVAPAIVAKKRAVERERVKDGLRRWVGAVWERRVKEKAEGIKRWEERVGVGRVWRLRRFWERVGRGEIQAI